MLAAGISPRPAIAPQRPHCLVPAAVDSTGQGRTGSRVWPPPIADPRRLTCSNLLTACDCSAYAICDMHRDYASASVPLRAATALEPTATPQ
jgi:hypothetical protein